MNSQPPIPDPQTPQMSKTKIKVADLLVTGFIYLVAVTVGYLILKRLDPENAVGLSQAEGSIIASCAAIWLYQAKNDEMAPFGVKATFGLTLAVLCIVQGLAFQQLWHWMDYPDVNISIGAIGGFLFPILLWKNFGKSIVQSRKPRGRM